MIRRFGLPLLVCLASLTPRAGLAEILWKGDFETGDLSQWSGKLNLMTNQRTNIKVIDTPRVGGLHAGELVIHPDDLWPNAHNRVELHQDVQTTDEGETTFLSWFFQLPAHAKQHNDIAYWESNASYQQSMAFFVEPANGGTELSFRTNRPNGTVHWKCATHSGRLAPARHANSMVDQRHHRPRQRLARLEQSRERSRSANQAGRQ